jgi:hypothetical protein
MDVQKYKHSINLHFISYGYFGTLFAVFIILTLFVIVLYSSQQALAVSIQDVNDHSAIYKNQSSGLKGHIIIPKPPLTIQTTHGSYYIQLLWDPEIIEAGKDTNFNVFFEDSSQSMINDIVYSFKVTESSGKVIADLHNQKTLVGVGSQTVRFTEPGPVDILVTIDGISGNNHVEGFLSKAAFHVVVEAPLPNESSVVKNATSGGTLDVLLQSSPQPIRIGDPTSFKVTFLHKRTSEIQPHIDYDFIIKSNNSKQLVYKASQLSDQAGKPLHTFKGSVNMAYTFQNSGKYIISIPVYGILFNPIKPEYASFYVIVR